MYSHQRPRVLALLLISIFCFSTGSRNAAATLTLQDTASLTIRVGNTGKATITSANPITAASEVVWSDLGDEIEKLGVEVSGNTSVTTFKAKSLLAAPKHIKVTIHNVEKIVKVETTNTVQIGDFPDPQPNESLSLTQGVPRPINLKNLVGVTIPSDGLVVDVPSDQRSSVLAEVGKTSITITGEKPTPSPVRVTVSSNGQTIKTYDVSVAEAADHIEIGSNTDLIEVAESDGEYLLSNLQAKVKGKSQGNLNEPLQFNTTNAAVASISPDQTKLIGHRPPTAEEGRQRLIISAPGVKDVPIPINILPAATSINITAQRLVAYVDRSDNTFHISVKDSSNKTMPDAPVTWDYKDAASKACLSIVNKGNTEVTVRGLKACPVATLVAKSVADPSVITELILSVRNSTPTGFAPLRIRIDVLDSQTARDLFGRKAADEFFISKIRLFNNLKNQNGEYGDSILVYSESLEVQVQLEMKNKTGGGDWMALPTDGPKDASYTGLFGTPDVDDIPPGNPPCKDKPQPNFVAHYRPYTFDIVANTHDRRDERSTRTRILTFANGLSSLASFITTVAVPAPGNDLRLGLDQFKGLLIPSFEKLFPSLKEVQRQNIISMVMRPLEEIPFGSDVTRILFIPKGKLYGMIPGKIFRIGGVSTSGACAQVGIIKKAGSEQ